MLGRRKKSPDRPTTARDALRVTRFPTTKVAGVPFLDVAHDSPWILAAPVGSQDRTDWLDDTVAAWAADLGWEPHGETASVFAEALRPVADAEPEAAARLLVVPEAFPRDAPALVEIDVLDEELMLLEHDEPDTWLAWRDLDPDARVKVRTFPRGWRYSSQLVEVSTGNVMLRAHKPLPDRGLHLTGLAFYSRGYLSGPILSAICRAEVPPA